MCAQNDIKFKKKLKWDQIHNNIIHSYTWEICLCPTRAKISWNGYLSVKFLQRWEAKQMPVIQSNTNNFHLFQKKKKKNICILSHSYTRWPNDIPKLVSVISQSDIGLAQNKIRNCVLNRNNGAARLKHECIINEIFYFPFEFCVSHTESAFVQ